MKKTSIVLVCFTLLIAPLARGEDVNPAAARMLAQQEAARKSEAAMTRFNLDFPGGTPGELVAAIQKATGKPLNVIIPDPWARVRIPALKMTNVNVAQLFAAVEKASALPAPGSYASEVPGYALYCFRTLDAPSDNSIWYFYAGNAGASEQISYVLLTPFLDQGLTVDDITSAAKTGWKMLDSEDLPKMSYHKETQLLIVVGSPRALYALQLELNALKQMKPRMLPTLSSGAPSSAKPATSDVKK